MLFCELPDGATGALPAWMTDAAACAALTVGAPVVSIAALQELRELLDAVAPRARVQAKVASGAGMRPTMSRGAPNAALLRAGWVGDSIALPGRFRRRPAGGVASQKGRGPGAGRLRRRTSGIS